MKWYSRLYVGDSISHKKNKIRWKINHNAGQIGITVIALASNPDNLLDIIPSAEMTQKAYPKKNLHIVGIAGDYAEAVQLVIQIVEETYLQTGDVKVREYIHKNGAFHGARGML